MNWNKVKTYLIISLLFVNILFVVSISLDFYKYRKASQNSIQMEQHLQQYLNQKQILLQASLIEYDDTMAPIDISYPELSEEDYPKLFQDYPMYTKIHRNKKLSINLPLAMVIKKDEKLDSYVQRFNNTYFTTESFFLKYKKEDEFNTWYYFTPIYHSKPLEEAFLTYHFDRKNQNLNIQKINIEVESTVYEQREISSPLKAVALAASRMPSHSVITDVELVYYYAPQKNSNIVTTESARAMPCWRIRTEDQEFYYISAIEQ